MSTATLFSPPDIEQAWGEWSCSCGPAAERHLILSGWCRSLIDAALWWPPLSQPRLEMAVHWRDAVAMLDAQEDKA